MSVYNPSPNLWTCKDLKPMNQLETITTSISDSARSNGVNKSKKVTRVTALLFVIALIAAACGGGSGSDDTINLADDGLTPPASETDAGGDVEGTRVDFTYESFEGGELQFADLTGNPTVVNFFASWCPTCIAELPDFERVSQAFAGEVEFLGLSVQDDPQLSLDLLAETGVTFPVGLDTPGNVFSQFGGLGMPTTVFIDGEGQVIDVHTGVLTEEALTEAIQLNILP